MDLWADVCFIQMRATKDRLQEDKYLVVVARELAKALKGLHEAGIIHRDVKGMILLLCTIGIFLH